jgi:hypothetical protein
MTAISDWRLATGKRQEMATGNWRLENGKKNQSLITSRQSLSFR